MDDRASIGPRLDPRRRDEWTGINFLLGEMDRLLARGLVLNDAYHTIVDEYSARRDEIEQIGRFLEAIGKARDLALISPREALGWATRAREIAPDRPEGWVVSLDLLRKMGRYAEADPLAEIAAAKFPDLVRPKPAPQSLTPIEKFLEEKKASQVELIPPAPQISWASVAGEFLEEHWQKFISALAVLLIVVSSTVGASLVLGPLLWSPAGKVVLALVFTGLCAGFGVGLARWGAERAGRMMLATSLIVIPVNFLLLGELRLLAGASVFEMGLVAVDAALLLALARGVIGALGFASPGTFAGVFFALGAFNAGASRGMPFEAGFAVFLAPSVLFLGAVAWLNRRPPKEAGPAYLEFGLFAFAFALGVLRTGGVVLQLGPSLYAVPAMLAAIACVSTARVIGAIEKDRRVVLLFEQGGLALSALAFALALARPGGPSALYSGNILAVALLGLALYATSLRTTRLPAYLYCGFAALFVAYFGTYYFAADLVRTVEEAARQALGYRTKLPFAFKAINGLVFNVALAWLSLFFARKWSDDRLARHCHYIGLPLSIAACVLSGFEPKAAVLCLTGYVALYALGTWIFAQPLLIYLACSATVAAMFSGSSLMGGASPEICSLIASGLGLAFWLIRAIPRLDRAGESYRTPLLHSARLMAALAMAAATLGAIVHGSIVPVSSLAFLFTAILALLNGRESPRVSISLLAIAGLLGAWLGGSHTLFGPAALTIEGHALAVSCFAIALVLAGEGVRHWLGTTGASGASLEAIGWAVPLLVLGGWGLAGWAWVDSVTVARSFLVGSTALIWLTRFRRESVLVYLGLAGLAVWACCLCGLVATGGGPGRLEGWLALTLAGVSLVDWGVGEWARRRDPSFYHHPCFVMAEALAVAAGLLATQARWFSVDSYRVGVSAMVGGSAALALVAWSRRRPTSVALAAGELIGAGYLALVSQGPASPDKAWVLAFVAALMAMVNRGVGTLVRRISREPDSPMARPLDFWALALTIGAIPLGYHSPPTLVAIALASLLLIGAFPSNLWLYSTAASLGSAAYFRWFTGLSVDGSIPFVVLGMYASYGVAVALQRSGPTLLGKLGLVDLGLHVPPVRVGVALGVLAVALRVGSIAATGGEWSALPWLPWVLAPFCLLMIRFEPRRGWVHLAVGLTGLGYAVTLAPWVEPGRWWLSASMGLACSWWLAARLAGRFEEPVRRRLGLAEGSDSGVLDDWSLAAFGLASLALVGVVGYETFARSFSELGHWEDGLLALGLAVVYIGLAGRRFGLDAIRIGFEVMGLMLVWWLAAPGSPLVVRLGLERDAYLPLATAAYSLGVAWLGIWWSHERSGGVVDPSGPLESPRRRWLVALSSWFVFGLALVSVFFSLWPGGWVSVGTLVLVSAALGSLALLRERVESAILGGITWCLACEVGLLMAARWSERFDSIEQTRFMAIGFALGLFPLWWAAGWARRRAEAKGGEPSGGRRVALALERVAIGATVPSTFFAIIDGYGDWLGLGVLFALAIFFVMVAWRRSAEWPVYVAQGFLLVGYFRARPLIVPSELADAVVLSVLAYLDLGLSELLTRLRWQAFARPTFRFAMVLPLVPILRGIWLQNGDVGDLFVLMATAAFYALAAFRLRSKTPAYAAAVLFNAFLWLAWSRLGWRLAEYPQFYFIPVGFTTILFGEANRQELGRSAVNAARNLGLVVIYASLVAPIWQTQSFGAWLALLLLSLVGIFAGIGLRIQSFLWLGLACFVLDVTYQLTRLGLEHVLARWAVMLTLGVALMLFVALNEKKRIVVTLRSYYDQARSWE